RRPGGTSTAAVTAVTFRRVPGQMVATLPGTLGARHLAPAEEASQDALVKARQVWPHEGVPANPTAWLVQVAKHRALDLLRRDQRLAPLPRAIEAGVGPTGGGAAARRRGRTGAPQEDGPGEGFLPRPPPPVRRA